MKPKPFSKVPYVINWNDHYREEVPINDPIDAANFYNTLFGKLKESGLVPTNTEYWRTDLFCNGKTEFRTLNDTFYFCVELDSYNRYVCIRRKYGYRYIGSDSASLCKKLGFDFNYIVNRIRSHEEYYPRHETITPYDFGKVKIAYISDKYYLFSNGEVYFLFQKLPED